MPQEWYVFSQIYFLKVVIHLTYGVIVILHIVGYENLLAIVN